MIPQEARRHARFGFYGLLKRAALQKAWDGHLVEPVSFSFFPSNSGYTRYSLTGKRIREVLDSTLSVIKSLASGAPGN